MLLTTSQVRAQSSDTTIKHKRLIPKRLAVRNIVWLTPTRAHQINGIALGTLPSSMWNNDSLHIRGLHVEVNPVMLAIVPYVVIGSLSSPFIWKKPIKHGDALSHYPDTIGIRSKNKISGLNISVLASAEMNYYSGISISSVATIGISFKGISVTLGQNNFYEYNGILIAGLMNNVNKGRGLQIGLINQCKECKGVQIGLLNKIGSRVLPIINLRL